MTGNCHVRFGKGSLPRGHLAPGWFATSLLSMGAVFALFAGFYFWTPKILGKTYNEFLGKLHFWTMFCGVTKNKLTRSMANFTLFEVVSHINYTYDLQTAIWKVLFVFLITIGAPAVLTLLAALAHPLLLPKAVGSDDAGTGAGC